MFMRGSKLTTIWKLSPGMYGPLAEAAILPLFVRAAFSTVGVLRTQGLLRRWARTSAVQPAEALGVVDRVLRAQNIVGRNLGRQGACLVRSLTLQTMLLRRGVDSTLRVGFRRKNGAMEGHAWIERDGHPLNESAESAATYVLLEDADSLHDWRSLK